VRRAQSEPFRLRRASTDFAGRRNLRGLSGQQILAETLQWFSAKNLFRVRRPPPLQPPWRPVLGQTTAGSEIRTGRQSTLSPRYLQFTKGRWGCKKISGGQRSFSGREMTSQNGNGRAFWGRDGGSRRAGADFALRVRQHSARAVKVGRQTVSCPSRNWIRRGR
jgi:hypothetical protein